MQKEVNRSHETVTNREHSFVRYADNCSIYAGSEKAAQRVLANITTYIEENLKAESEQRKKQSKPIRVVNKTIKTH